MGVFLTSPWHIDTADDTPSSKGRPPQPPPMIFWQT